MQGLEEPQELERPQRGSSAALDLLSGALSTTPDGTPRAPATIEGLSGIFGREARSGGPARTTSPHAIAGGADLGQPCTLGSVRSGGLPPGGSHSFSRSSARSGGMPPANRCAPPSGSAGDSALPPSTHALEAPPNASSVDLPVRYLACSAQRTHPIASPLSIEVRLASNVW